MIRGALAFFVLMLALAAAGIEIHDFGRFCRKNPDRRPIVVLPEHERAAALIGSAPTYLYCSDQTGHAYDRRAYPLQFAATPAVARLISSVHLDLIATGLRQGEIVVMDSLPRNRIDEIRTELRNREVSHHELVLAPDLVLLLPGEGS